MILEHPSDPECHRFTGQRDEARTGMILSPSGKYRYLLWSVWDEFLPIWFFGLLNPSSATHEEGDNTFDRQVTRAKHGGTGGIIMGNAGAIRQTDRLTAVSDPDPIGPDNRYWLKRGARVADKIILGYGPDAAKFGGDKLMRETFGNAKVFVLKITKNGTPGHPLYLGYDTPLIPFTYGDL